MTPGETAAALVQARRNGLSLAAFPGGVPDTLDAAYAVQLEAIALWPDEIAGWKVGRLSPSQADRFGVDRFVGPVFRNGVKMAAADGCTAFPLIAHGSGAFEAECTVTLSADYGTDAVPATIATARALVEHVCISVEIAGSPLTAMADLGSLASIADLGNNNGQILGPRLSASLLDLPERFACAVTIDDQPAGRASAADLPGGPLTALAFALSQTAKLGHPARAGQFISTGAITGMHWVTPGSLCSADFGQLGRIECRTAAIRSSARPQE